MMKKTILFLLCALMLSAVPGNGLKAQVMRLNLTVSTLDRAPITSAQIFAPSVGQTYFVDSAHLDPSWSGSALPISTVNVFQNFYIEGNQVIGTVDSTLYSHAIIVVGDAADRYYVLSAATRAQYDTGVFSAGAIFTSATDGVFNYTFTPPLNLIGRDRARIADGDYNYYTSFDTALMLCETNATLTFQDTIHLTRPVVLDRRVTVNQAAKPIVVDFTPTSPVVSILNANVLWIGNSAVADIVVPATTEPLFKADNANFTFQQYTATSDAPILSVGGTTTAAIYGCNMNATGDEPAIRMSDAANVNIMSVNATGTSFVRMDSSSTGYLSIPATVVSTLVPAIDADAFYNTGANRVYYRTLGLTAAAASDTVFLTRSTRAGSTDTIANAPLTIELSGNLVRGSLCFNHNSNTVLIQNGTVNQLVGVAGAAGRVVLTNLDSVGNFVAGDLATTIANGRFSVINPATGANVKIYGGKYNDNYSGYLANRHVMVPNDEFDSASFHYKVVNGYRVTFVNFNARGEDSVIIVDAPDNHVPLTGRPSYIGADTIFGNYWVNPTFRTPWNFQNDVLTTDTTLYAQWYIFQPGDVRHNVLVHHNHQNLDGTYSLYEDMTIVVRNGFPVTVFANDYPGFTPDVDSFFVDALTADTVFTFNYSRDSYTLTWDFNGGSTATPFSTVQTLFFGETISYPAITRPGHLFSHWTPTGVVTMPAHDLTLMANYVTVLYPLTWVGADTTVIYNGLPVAALSASYVNDEGTTVIADLTYTDAEGNTVTPVNVGVYTAHATTSDTNYTLLNTTAVFTIAPATVSVSGIVVDTVKVYDGTRTVNVVSHGTPAPVFSGDDLTSEVVALYDDAEIGTDKVINATFTLSGIDADNYTVSPATVVLCDHAVILEGIVFETDSADNGIAVSADGYCAGDNAGIGFFLESGTPNQYMLTFGTDEIAQGFANVAWTTLPASGQIALTIPATAEEGTHTVTLVLRDSAYPTFESTPVTVNFIVNLNKDYVRPIFSDVITIVDTCHCIDQNSIQWYRDGAAIPGAIGPYYYEAGGLAGHTYHVDLVINGVSTRTCEQTDVTTLVTEVSSEATLSVYPNPTVDQVTVAIEHSDTFVHTLRVMNTLGMTVLNTTFQGESTVVDLSSLSHGNYTVSVDGIVVRVIKK